MLKRAGYPPDVGGAILSASGIGAIISPPSLGAAAFLIAENLGIPYLQILDMAIVPTLLYYLSILTEALEREYEDSWIRQTMQHV